MAADLSAVAVEQAGAPCGVGEVAARVVPDAGVLGGDGQGRAGASADEDRRVGTRDWLGIAERADELVVGAVEVERFGLGPEPPDDGAASARLPVAWAAS